MKDSKKMINKEISFMKKKGAPKSMIKHEVAEKQSMGYAGGGMVMRGTGAAIKGKKFSRAG
jgi:hypothetical protein